MNIDDLKGCFANITDDELLRDNGNLYAENKELKIENKRLNNIINELERCFEKTWQDYKDSESENLYAIAIENKNYFEKLQELKGSEKE